MPETVVGASDTVSERNKHRSLGIVGELWFLPPTPKEGRKRTNPSSQHVGGELLREGEFWECWDLPAN